MPFRWRGVICALVMGWLGAAGEAYAAVRGTVIFSAATNLSPTVSNPWGVAVGDLDGDGWPDIAVSSNSPERIVWYRNDGNGGFSSVQYVITTSPASAAISNVALGDLNMDGRLDALYWAGTEILWTPNLGGSDPAAQFGHNPGNETANQFFVTTSEPGENNVAISDLNHDGRPDVLAYAVAPTRSILWVPNLVSGFGPKVVFANAGLDPSSIQGTDVDQDGLRDIVITSIPDHLVAWYRNTGAGNFSARQTISNAVSFSRGVSFADLNGDGRRDAWCVGSPFGTASPRWFAQNAAGVTPRFSTTANLISTFNNGGSRILARDMNSDGRPDAVIAAGGTNRILWVENLGAGNFGPLTTNQVFIGSVNGPNTLEVEDLDGNGTFDVVTTAVFAARAMVFWNRGGQTAVTTANVAPAALMAGRRDAFLRVEVSSRGVAGDAAATLDSLTLLLESSAGVPLNTAQANAMIDKISLHADADGSGTFDSSADPAVATVSDLQVTNGRLLFSCAGAAASDVEVAPGATRTYFVVLKMAEFAAVQSPNTVRVSHLSHGTGRSVIRDATTSAQLTVESNSIVNAPSAVVSALPAHTYSDHAFLYFDSATAPGTGATDDFDGDGTPNLSEFGFGMDPASSLSSGLVVSGGTIVQRGLPVAVATNTGTGVNFQALFVRRKNPLAGLSYSVQFSATLASWVTSAATPVVIADDGAFEVVSVPYPFFVNGRKARFFRVQVTSQ